MSFTDKIDVLDLIINVLNEHERKLDELVDRLEVITKILEEHPDFAEPMTVYHSHVEVMEDSSYVLIVDDDEFLTETFKVLLEDSGFMVETANNGNEAILKASQRNFDLAILDLILPDMDGKELSKKLKKKNRSMNVILLTGKVEALEEINYENSGSDEILIKPISPEELLKVTEKLKNRV
ncbi:response regulator [Candidatus Bathyarchaeota archaeon]|jgi:CheY-like chemotaxis protein|nr:response regulator [Candidatus Bathyarchaeota archaeon]